MSSTVDHLDFLARLQTHFRAGGYAETLARELLAATTLKRLLLSHDEAAAEFAGTLRTALECFLNDRTELRALLREASAEEQLLLPAVDDAPAQPDLLEVGWSIVAEGPEFAMRRGDLSYREACDQWDELEQDGVTTARMFDPTGIEYRVMENGSADADVPRGTGATT